MPYTLIGFVEITVPVYPVKSILAHVAVVSGTHFAVPLASKNTLSVDVGIEAPPGPTDTVDQFAVFV